METDGARRDYWSSVKLPGARKANGAVCTHDDAPDAIASGASLRSGQTEANAATALCPPKPNELLIAS